MANPNLANVTSIYGKTAYQANLANSDQIQLFVDADKVLKINTIIAANIDGTNDADVTVFISSDSNLTPLGYLAKTITVPADSSLVITSKDTSFYLAEDRRIIAFASGTNDISLTISYEEMDDA